MGYFQGDQENFGKVTEDTGTKKGDEVCRHPLTYLLEAADDIAYATADLEDGFKKGIFTLDEFINKMIVSCGINDLFGCSAERQIDVLKGR